MSGSDHLQWNTRERLTSTDLNDAQSMKDRVLLDALRRGLEVRTYAVGANPAGAVRDAVLGGLQVSPNVNDVDVSAGALLQDSAVLAPAPGALDSPYRIAINRAAETVVMPAPGATTFYLLEAQMVEVVTLNEVRDIWDPGLGVYVPAAVDKRLERQINFQITAGVGTNAPAPTGTPWVPIAVIRRPGGGGPVVASDIFDVRPLWDDRFPVGNDQADTPVLGEEMPRSFRTVHLPGAAASALIFIEGRVVDNGLPLWFTAGGTFDPGAAAFLDPGAVLAANTWFYLYLVPWATAGVPLAPRNAYAAHTGKGLLVLSDTAPVVGDPRASGNIQLPAPWSVGGAVLAAEAICIGALRRNAANTGWDWTQRMGPGLYRIEWIEVLAAAALPAQPETVNLAAFLPSHAKAAILRHTWTQAPPTGQANASIEVAPVGATGVADYNFFAVDAGMSGDVLYEVPTQATQSFDLNQLVIPNRRLLLIGYRT